MTKGGGNWQYPIGVVMKRREIPARAGHRIAFLIVDLDGQLEFEGITTIECGQNGELSATFTFELRIILGNLAHQLLRLPARYWQERRH